MLVNTSQRVLWRNYAFIYYLPKEERSCMRQNIVKLGKKITDCMDVKMGLIKLDEKRPEYWMLDALLTDEMAELVLKMEVRKPVTVAELAKKIKWDEVRVQRILDEVAQMGLIEYNWHNADHHKQYVLPIFVVGSCENLILDNNLLEKHPEIAEFFYQMAYLPLEMLSHMVPPGGAGLGFHVIPIEKAIPKDSASLDVEHLSHWLEKYRDKLAITQCVCRRSMRIRGEGCGELEDEVCIVVGDYAQFLTETGKATPATYDEIMALLQRTEDCGYMHQITNGDGPDDIFAICNCTVGSCFGLRCSQLFNAPNLSASAYKAEVTTENCVACGKCVEACPTGAAKLGQKLCTNVGPISYPKQPLPDLDPNWGKHMWNYNYRDDNQINCYDTGTAPCKTACPAHIAIQGYVKMAAEGRYEEALALIKQDNPFPAVCGSICNKRCEDACTRGELDNPIAIDEIKKFIASLELNAETRYIPKKVRHKGDDTDYTEKIAIIGAGPSGMTCAYFLAAMSYPVTVFDKNPVPGGMLTMGIPNFRLEKDVVNAEIDVLREMGVDFKCGVEVGKDITIQQLRDEGYKAFYVAIGAQKGIGLGVEGEELSGVRIGVDFLRELNSGNVTALAGDTVVIGGGNAAIDVSRAVTRLGDGTVSMYCLETDADMPTVPDEKNEALKEGILINNCWGPKRILGKNGKVTGVEFKRCLSVRDESGHFAPRYDENDTTIVHCSNVIVSIGQFVDWGNLLDGTKADPKGARILKVADITFQSDEPDIFGGGDAVTGPKYTIDAIATGREGAISLHRFVHAGQSLTLARNRREFVALDKSKITLPVDSMSKPARQELVHDEGKTKTMSDNRLVFTEEQVKLEASRCLSCGATVVDQNKCIGCGLCTTRCNFDAMHIVRSHPENANYINGDDSKKAIMLNGAKRAAKIAVKRIKDKVAT